MSEILASKEGVACCLLKRDHRKKVFLGVWNLPG